MKTNYESWMPKSVVNFMRWVSIITGIIFALSWLNIFLKMQDGISMGKVEFVLTLVVFILFVSSFSFYRRFTHMRMAFDFTNKESLSWRIISFIGEHMILEPGKKILDVGCGSGALAILLAKKNPESEVIGMDKWGGVYKNFSKELCEYNRKVEGIENVSFENGNAKKLKYEDESFDGLVSNYVYHNIIGNRQDLVFESLRVLKKGGKFAIHDLFTKNHYGDLEAFNKRLKEAGIERFEFLDTTSGNPMSKEDAAATMTVGSKLLVGVK